MLIASACPVMAVTLFGREEKPSRSFRRVTLAAISIALFHTVFSERLNTGVLKSWAHRDAMPRLPWLGSGLSPVLQWIFVPDLAFPVSQTARI